MFKVFSKDLGVVKKGQTLKIEFPFENVKSIDKLEYCNCMIVQIKMKQQMIYVEYVVPAIPQHLKDRAYWDNGKTITVYYTPSPSEDGTSVPQMVILKYSMRIVK